MAAPAGPGDAAEHAVHPRDVRPPAGVWWAVVAVAAAGAGGTAALVGTMAASHSLDLRIYRAAALSMVHGGPVYASTFSDHLNFTYPPFALLFFTPLTMLGLTATSWAWAALNVAGLAAGAAAVARRTLHLSIRRAVLLGVAVATVATLTLEPVRSSVLYGQVNLVLIGAITLDLLWVPARQRGVITGVAAAIKLTPLVFVVYLLCARERAAAVRLVGGFGAATALAWVLLPHDTATFWLHQAFSPSRKGGTNSAWNQSWWGFVHRLPPADGWERGALWLAACALTLSAAAYVARRNVDRGQRADALVAVAIAGLLVSPVSWTHHWSWVALVPVLLLQPRARHRTENVALAVLVLLTIPAPYAWHERGPWYVLPNFSLLFAGAALLVVMVVVAATRRPPARPVTETPTSSGVPGDQDAGGAGGRVRAGSRRLPS